MPGGRPPTPFLPRYWSMVDKSPHPLGCWVWTGTWSPKAYGTIRRNGFLVRAHRVALEMKLDRDIIQGMMCCHNCNNTRCVNPEHLYEGTAKQNAADCFNSGRHISQNKTDWKCYATGEDHHWTKDPTHAIGENNGRHILLESDIPTIRLLVTSGASIASIAREYNVSWSAIKYVVSGRNWSHVK